MNRLLFIASFFLSLDLCSQIVTSPKLGLLIESELQKEIADKFSTFLEKEVSKVYLVSLEPECIVRTSLDSLNNEVSDTLCFLSTCIQTEEPGVDTSRFFKKVNLSPMDISSLLKILYRNDKNSQNTWAACYQPRHAMVFYNSKGRLIGYIEICLSCSAIRTSGGTPSPGNLFEQDYKDLKTLIRKYLILE
jgi:hypothetical protein